MGKISILDDKVSNMIAAGEVVDNPASLVKELLENSFDAEATAIRVDVKQGGRYIRMSDNGVGMDKSDLLLCIERHATSKISTKEDIFNILSYGFRGEALSSIAAVSKMTISSKTADDIVGTSLVVSGGKITDLKTSARNVGTDIEIASLFYNTPARLNFLKSKVAEYNVIKDIVLKEALANYNCAIILTIEGKIVLKTTGTGLKNSIIELFGIHIFKSLHPCDYGYVGNLSLTRGRKDSMYTFVNRRVVKANLLEEAILEGYYTYLMKGKFPFVILFVEVKPEEIDINVHPSKKVVRFRQSQRLFFEIKDHIQNSLKQFATAITQSYHLDKFQEKAPETQVINSFDTVKNLKTDLDVHKTRGEVGVEILTLDPTRSTDSRGRGEEKAIYPFTRSETGISREAIDSKTCDKPYLPQGASISDSIAVEEISQPNYGADDGKNRVSLSENVTVLGQLNKMYILVQEGRDLKIFDQHVVHERLLYEKHKTALEKRNMPIKQLLIPQKVPLQIMDIEKVIENRAAFETIGFYVDIQGKQDLYLTAVPDIKMHDLYETVFQEILDEIDDLVKKDLRESLIIRLACHESVKAGEKLSLEFMKAVIDALYALGSFTCPHGRPIVITVKHSELEKNFKRI